MTRSEAHTLASRLVMAGVDLRTAQELMGHKTITMDIAIASVTTASTRGGGASRRWLNWHQYWHR